MQTACTELKQMCLKASYDVIKASEELLDTLREIYTEKLCHRPDLVAAAEIVKKMIESEKEYIDKLRRSI